MSYTVGAVAEMAGITVRTLHHYHEIGLLEPSGRSAAGYRLYSDDDVSRLQELLFYRELGMALDEIAAVLGDLSYERRSALLDHRRLLNEKRARLDRLIGAVDAALHAETRGIQMDAKDKLEVFGDFDPAQYEAEVEQRWGETDAYKESTRRAKRYGKQEWLRIKEEGDHTIARFVELKRAGAAPTDEAALATAEEARQHICRWFYDCPPKMHASLGAMYTEDPRFTATYDQHEPGLAQFVREAIEANAARQ